MSRRRIAFWLLFAAMCVAYVYVAGVSFDYLTMEADGLKPFDLMAGGYTLDQANAFLGKLSPEGYAHYMNIQQPLDLLFIGLYAATFFFAIQALVPSGWSERVYRILPLAPLVPAVFDLLENRAVEGLVRAGAGHITPEAVEAASRWTVLKGVTGMALLVLILVLLVMKAAAIFRARARTGRV